MKHILVTGSNGMLGQHIVKGLVEAGQNVLGVSIEKEANYRHDNYIYQSLDLTRCMDVEALFEAKNISHIIHLAAIAHTYKGMDDTWSNYYRINTLCSKTIFMCANDRSIPVFFASSIDVYGITNGEVNEDTLPSPVGSYACSKWMAEEALKDICKDTPYMIARFAPIYTSENQKDIRKRYYLRYPKVCYKLGKGKEYEFLAVEKVVRIINQWVAKAYESKEIINIRDDKRFNSKDLIEDERLKGNAKIVIWIPEWIVTCLKKTVDLLLKSKPTIQFTTYKVICPIKTDSARMKLFISKQVE